MENLTKAQKHVLRLIFEHKKSEEEALEEAKIAKRVYDGWFRQKLWNYEYSSRLKSCQRTANLIIATFKEMAAIKLVSLTDCEKGAVARPACLDILEMDVETDEPREAERRQTLRPETQAAIMKLMANEKKNDEPLEGAAGGAIGAGAS